MIHIDKDHLDNRCEEIIKDVKEKKMTSAAWLWVGLGALAGLVTGSVRFKKEEKKDGIAGSNRNSKDYSGFRAKKVD